MLIPVTIAEVLAQMEHHCHSLAGAVVSTRDGLVLAATSSFGGDTPAACAASLTVHLENDLSLIQPVSVSESLFWTSCGVWYLARLVHQHLLMAHCTAPDQAGSLRLAGQMAAQQLGRMLSPATELH